MWAQPDLVQMSLGAAEWLARLFLTIEGGAAWPAQVLVARTAYLSKTSGGSLSPLDYRVLSITS
eukprot:769466-Alexandrium_andersonii.AAC.1